MSAFERRVWVRTEVRRYVLGLKGLERSGFAGVAGDKNPRPSPSLEIAWVEGEEPRAFYIEPHILMGLVAPVLAGVRSNVHVTGRAARLVTGEPRPGIAVRGLREPTWAPAVADLAVSTCDRVPLDHEHVHPEACMLYFSFYDDRPALALYVSVFDLCVGIENARGNPTGAGLLQMQRRGSMKHQHE